ncbi:Rieske (2Fe-2S) protein [Pararhizobium antarcticum]|uniref:Oxidoreductase n=1 Tax=Pararhizobium antarcticum TaxID=1798805 RepID=A0A657M0G2_9HYPH|nr:Rieske (2Fe-2S) protein [Pararhizobium antarcticum]OJG01563.1 oxidoreductase [Pararhizobium antarcticum]
MLSDTTGSWTPVALSQDLPAGTVIPAYIVSGSIALWRSDSGRIAASADRCPHRGMRLSHGFVRGEAISCIYHGWSYAQSGHCLRIPAHPGLKPPETIRVATYVVEEADGVIWVAAGAPGSMPPGLDGFVPFRSLTVHAARAAIEDAAGATAGPEGLVDITSGAGNIRLLLSAQDGDRTLVHVLLVGEADAATRISASRTVESLRRTAEDRQEKAAAQ